jgi:hypothetical protein
VTRWLLTAVGYLLVGAVGLYQAFSGFREGWEPLTVGVASCVGSLALIRGGMLLERARTATDAVREILSSERQ